MSLMQIKIDPTFFRWHILKWLGFYEALQLCEMSFMLSKILSYEAAENM